VADEFVHVLCLGRYCSVLLSGVMPPVVRVVGSTSSMGFFFLQILRSRIKEIGRSASPISGFAPAILANPVAAPPRVSALDLC